MLKRFLTILTVILFLSCGKDVVEIIDTPILNEPQEIFEVNVLGHSTDSEHNFLEGVDLTISGITQNTDSTSFFVKDKVLIGKEGKVVKAEKDGFLPIYKRVYHHRSLEDVVTNITMFDSPSTQEMNVSGGSIISIDGTVLSMDQGAISQSSDISLFTSFNLGNQVDFDPFIVTDDAVKILNDQAFFFIGSSVSLNQDKTLSLKIESDNLIDIDNVSLYRYNESKLTWELKNIELQESNGSILLTLDSFGWWALGSELETVYGTIQFNQEEGSSDEISPISNSEVVFVRAEDRNSNEHLFTNDEGEISKYYAVESQQRTVSLNDQNSEVVFEIDFTSLDRSQVVQLDEQIINKISAEVYDCELDKQIGYITIVSGNQYVVKRLEGDEIDVSVNIDNENLELRFYDLEERLLTTRSIVSDDIMDNTIQFVACNPIMLVEKGTDTVHDFDQCKVRVKPIESFIVGENGSSQFLIGFRGGEVGKYDALVYPSDVTLFEDLDLEADIEVDIMIYDRVSKTIAGFVDGKYLNGDEYKVSFIGNVEE